MSKQSICIIIIIKNTLYKSIFSPEQNDVFRLLKEARKRSFYMVGGTAIALHIGHRKSIDFDLFLATSFRKDTVQNICHRAGYQWDILHIAEDGNCTGVIHGVKVTFFHFPFPVVASVDFEGWILIPDLLTLGAMKAYALGRRAKWKDYVDLYFILQDHSTIDEISVKAQEIFAGNFNSRHFREQLGYFDYIDYTEAVEYLIDDPPSDETVKNFLREASLM